MDISSDSDSDQEGMENPHLDGIITDAQAKKNYNEAGKLVMEDADRISIKNHMDLIDSSMNLIISDIVNDRKLPYELSDFQNLSINTLLQKKDLILLSPTGSGKGCKCNILYINKYLHKEIKDRLYSSNLLFFQYKFAFASTL